MGISKFILNIFFLTALDFVQSEGTCQNYYNQQGVCVPLDSCPSLSRLNSDPTKSFYDQMIIDRSYCKGSYNDKVCCTDGRTKGSTEGSTALPKVTKRTKPAYHGNKERDLLPVPGSEECGLQAADKIVGGNITAINEYPWLASLEYTWADGYKSFLCGGFLMNDRYVVTAAHCIKTVLTWKKPILSGVRLGEWNQDTDQDCQAIGITTICSDPPQNFDIEKMIIHPGYREQKTGSKDDIALLRLSKPAKMSTYVRPICLPFSQNLQQRTDNYGTRFTVAGWGRTENFTSSAIKLKVDVDGVSLTDCKRKFDVWEKQICAGGITGKDSCRGDSGGPLMGTHADAKGSNYWYAAGIVSYGLENCGTKGTPAVYTRVDRYIDWITDQVKT